MPPLPHRETRRMEMAGGYRLVRKLGEGSRSTVFLGRAASDDETGSVAVKIFRASTTAREIEGEIEALARSSHRHLAELLDLSLMPDGRSCLILRRLSSTSLATLLARSTDAASLGLGEVVTALVPIARALGELHRVGIAHGGVSAESILLDELGAPVLIGFGQARVVGPVPQGTAASLAPAQLGANAFVRADLVAFARLTMRMLTAVVSPESDGLVRQTILWLEQFPDVQFPDAQFPDAQFPDGGPRLTEGTELTALADRLFELAPAAEIRLRGGAVSTASRLPPAAPASSPSVPVVTAAAPRRGSGRSVGSPSGIPSTGVRKVGPLRALDPAIEFLGKFLDGGSIGRDGIGRVRARLRAAIAPVRRPVWIAGGIGLAALVGGVIVIPAVSAAEVATVPVRAATAEPHPAASRPAASRPAASKGAAAPPAAGPSRSADPDPAPATASTGDDPVLAGAALAKKRDGCLESGSVKCLASVDQVGSAAEDIDRQSVRDIRAADTRLERKTLLDRATLTDATFSLAQSIGDTAILTVGRLATAEAGSPTTTASVLMIRTEAGWRFRDVLLGG